MAAVLAGGGFKAECGVATMTEVRPVNTDIPTFVIIWVGIVTHIPQIILICYIPLSRKVLLNSSIPLIRRGLILGEGGAVKNYDQQSQEHSRVGRQEHFGCGLVMSSLSK